MTDDCDDYKLAMTDSVTVINYYRGTVASLLGLHRLHEILMLAKLIRNLLFIPRTGRTVITKSQFKPSSQSTDVFLVVFTVATASNTEAELQKTNLN